MMVGQADVYCAYSVFVLSSRNSLVTFSYFVKYYILFVKEQQITPAFKVSIIQIFKIFPPIVASGIRVVCSPEKDLAY